MESHSGKTQKTKKKQKQNVKGLTYDINSDYYSQFELKRKKKTNPY